MRTEINTSGTQFQVASAAKAKSDYKDKSRQATTLDGRPRWSVKLTAIDTVHETSETIFVEVAGAEPKLTFNSFAVVRGLVYVPWVGRDGKIRRAFRADSIEAAPASKAAG